MKGKTRSTAGSLTTFAPYLNPFSTLPHITADMKANFSQYFNAEDLQYQLAETSAEVKGGDTDARDNLPTGLQAYVDFTEDRDLLGNPRTIHGSMAAPKAMTRSPRHPSTTAASRLGPSAVPSQRAARR